MGNLYETVNRNGYLGTDGNLSPRQHHSPRLSWLDLRVFYVRISRCEVDDSTPQQLILNHIPLDPNTLLEVNGVRASLHSDGVIAVLRRNRVDKKSEEATFVCTDSVRTTGSVKFEVFDKDVLVLTGSLDKCECNGFSNGDESDRVSIYWSISCETDVSVGNGFFKGKRVKGCELASPVIEVYVAGCYMGTPIMLTKTLQLNSRRKKLRMGMLNSIPEHYAIGNEKESPLRLALQGKEYQIYKPESEGYPYPYPYGLYHCGKEYFEGDDGELSWFNAGVRVGVGIGLGVSVGIGIGLGLLVKTYQGTTRTFRRRLF